MNDLASILCNGLLPNLGNEPAVSGGFQAWCTRGNYTLSPSPTGSLVFGRIPAREFVLAINFDFERFALSGKESFSVALCEKKTLGSLSWPLLKHYYSSFYSAHAIMRSRAAGVVRLDKAHTDFINDTLALFDPLARGIGPGMFVFRRVRQSTDGVGELSISLTPERRGKGVHESFWREFCDFLISEAADSVSRGEPDSAAFVVAASELKDAVLLGRGSSTWISFIRNEINYQHQYDTWMPYKKSSNAYQALKAGISPPLAVTSLDIPKDKKPIEAFLNIACRISGTSFFVSEYLARRSKKGGAFGQKWRRLNATLST